VFIGHLAYTAVLPAKCQILWAACLKMSFTCFCIIAVSFIVWSSDAVPGYDRSTTASE